MKKIEITVVKGVEGVALYANDYRVAGPKPWGGGNVIHKFEAPISEIETAIGKSRGQATQIRNLESENATLRAELTKEKDAKYRAIATAATYLAQYQDANAELAALKLKWSKEVPKPDEWYWALNPHSDE